MGKSPSSYLKEPYSRILIPDEDGSYAAGILEFPGCHAQGATPDEAIRNLESAAEAWIEAALEQGQEIPEPQMNQGFSGKIALRLPRGLHRQAAQMAEHDGTSLNQFLTTAIAARVGAEDFYSKLLERLEQRFATVTFAPRITILHAQTSRPTYAGIGTAVVGPVMPIESFRLPEGSSGGTTVSTTREVTLNA